MPGAREDYLTWDEYFMNLALLTTGRSKDPSTQVGACIVKDNRVLSQGYNGATRGMHDDDMPWDSVGETTGDKKHIKNYFVVHSELNAILNYRGSLQDFEGATLYVTLFPCNECAKALAQVGIKKVVYAEMYKHSDLVEITKMIFEKAGIEVMKYNSEKNKVFSLHK